MIELTRADSGLEVRLDGALLCTCLDARTVQQPEALAALTLALFWPEAWTRRGRSYCFELRPPFAPSDYCARRQVQEMLNCWPFVADWWLCDALLGL